MHFLKKGLDARILTRVFLQRDCFQSCDEADSKNLLKNHLREALFVMESYNKASQAKKRAFKLVHQFLMNSNKIKTMTRNKYLQENKNKKTTFKALTKYQRGSLEPKTQKLKLDYSFKKRGCKY